MCHLKWKSSILLFFVISSLSGLTVAAEAADEQQENAKQIPMEDIQRFSNAMGIIKKYYVKKVSDKVLFENAIRGMLNGLDPHSSYLDKDEYQELQTATSGEFGGLGIEVTMDEGVIKVITPLVDSPAYKAGIKSGDYIVKIDKSAVQGMKLKDAVEMMRGEIGSPVNLTVLRKGQNKLLHFAVKRDKIVVKSVKSRLLDKDYGYIRLSQFQTLTGQDMIAAINAMKKEAGGQLKGLILDLRNNPGGLLDSAIQISDAFLAPPKGDKNELIVYTEGRFPGSEFKATANPGDILNNAPMVVLINNGSASASEIVAGALKDNKRAIIVGTKSFGKGSVQTVLPIDENHAIKLTTALYYTPAGVSIQARGITPDIVIEDMQIPKDKAQSDFSDFTEASLSGHLVNQGDAKSKNKIQVQANTQSDAVLLHEDYQLYAALTILRGIAVAKQ